MPWVKLDDQFIFHPKAILAGKDGRALYLTALCYSANQLTDGRIRTGVLPMVARLAEVDDAETVAEHLVDVGLFERADDGYQIHDYHKYNPTAADVKKQRAENAERQAAWRDRNRQPDGTIAATNPATAPSRSSVTNTVSHSASNGPVTPLPYPVPVPVPDRKENRKTADAHASGADAPTEHQARFAALARGCGHNLEHLGDRERKSVATAAASLKRFTPGQIETMCRNYPTHFRGAITAPMVAGNASKLLEPGPYALSPPGRNGRANGGIRPGESGGWELVTTREEDLALRRGGEP